MSNQSGTVVNQDAAAALSLIDSGLSALAELGIWQLPDGDLGPVYARLETASRRLAGQSLRVLADAGSRGLAARIGSGQLGGWVRHVVPTIAPGEAAGRGRDAELFFTDPIAAELSPTRERLLAGDVSGPQARVITGAIVKLSPPVCPAGVVDAETLTEAQDFLLAQAGTFDARQLRRLATALVTRLDPGAADRLARDEDAQRAARGLTLAPDSTGMWHLAGRLTPACGHAVATAIDAWSAPHPATDGSADPRTAAQRRHDGLQRLCEQAVADPDLLPASHGSPYRITVTVDHRALAAALSDRQAQLGLPLATLPDGTPLSPLTLDTLACDAEILPVLIDQAGNPLDVADTQYPFPRKQRHAIATRDGHCSYPNCAAPPPWCHTHHLVPASRGGPTSVANGTLLCGRHHRYVHATKQTGQLINGQVLWRPPGYDRHDPPPTPAAVRARQALDALVRRWTARSRQ